MVETSDSVDPGLSRNRKDGCLNVFVSLDSCEEGNDIERALWWYGDSHLRAKRKGEADFL